MFERLKPIFVCSFHLKVFVVLWFFLSKSLWFWAVGVSARQWGGGGGGWTGPPHPGGSPPSAPGRRAQGMSALSGHERPLGRTVLASRTTRDKHVAGTRTKTKLLSTEKRFVWLRGDHTAKLDRPVLSRPIPYCQNLLFSVARGSASPTREEGREGGGRRWNRGTTATAVPQRQILSAMLKR